MTIVTARAPKDIKRDRARQAGPTTEEWEPRFQRGAKPMLRGKSANLKHLYQRYRLAFDREWPHDDTYLRQLTREAASEEQVLELMRECDGTK